MVWLFTCSKKIKKIQPTGSIRPKILITISCMKVHYLLNLDVGCFLSDYIMYVHVNTHDVYMSIYSYYEVERRLIDPKDCDGPLRQLNIFLIVVTIIIVIIRAESKLRG